MTQTDLTYMTDGVFTKFIAWTDAGEDVWREMANKMGGVAAVLNFEAPRVIKQIRAAGYSVTKAKPSKMSAAEILKELDANWNLVV